MDAVTAQTNGDNGVSAVGYASRAKSDKESESGTGRGTYIQGIHDLLFVKHIFPRITHPCVRNVLRTVNRQWEAINRRLDKDIGFACEIVARRRQLRLARLPCLIVFEPVGTQCDPAPRAHQCFFHDGAATSGRPHALLPCDGSPAPALAGSCHAMSAWPAVGCQVFLTAENLSAEGHMGELDPLHWKWTRTHLLVRERPPAPSPRCYSVQLYHSAPRGSLEAHRRTLVAVVGNRVAKVVTGLFDNRGVIARGLYYDAECGWWCHLAPLARPWHVFEASLLEVCHLFEWMDHLYVVCYDAAVEEMYVSRYDFESERWSDWNGDAVLVVLRDALSSLVGRLYHAGEGDWSHLMWRPFEWVRLVGADDGTLFAVCPVMECGEGRIAVFYLNTCKGGSSSEGFEKQWRQIAMPMKEQHRYVAPMAWALKQGNAGVVVVSRIFNRAKVAWWFLTKAGVYERGGFRDVVRLNSFNTRFALLHVDY